MKLPNKEAMKSENGRAKRAERTNRGLLYSYSVRETEMMPVSR